MQTKIKRLVLCTFLFPLLAISFNALAQQQTAGQTKPLDPKAWGSNHANKPVPEFVHGDECLFCHRNDIGPSWATNVHGVTVRAREDAPELEEALKQPALAPVAHDVEYFLGSRHRIRFLKKTGYGKFSLLTTQAALDAKGHVEKLVDPEHPTWDKDRFANRCAGCHATGVETATRAFSVFGLDCYACHGVVDLDHTKDTSLISLSKKRRTDARAITSACAQCHVRNARSGSTGLPYPNNFVTGDNLFQDYAVDFSKADDASLNPGDRHILQNIRDVVINGSESPTCITCHDVHKGSSLKHRIAQRTAMCADCHNTDGPIVENKAYTVHSDLCEY
jgi:predicted CXXCH cytochrome family protein